MMNAKAIKAVRDAAEVAGLGIALYAGAVGSAVALGSGIDAALLHRRTVRARVPSLTVRSGKPRTAATTTGSSVGLRDAA
jgi:hypothetical protein